MAVSVSLTWYRLCLGLFLLILPQESPYRCSCLSAAISTTEVYWRHSACYVTEARARGRGQEAQTRARTSSRMHSGARARARTQEVWSRIIFTFASRVCADDAAILLESPVVWFCFGCCFFFCRDCLQCRFEVVFCVDKEQS